MPAHPPSSAQFWHDPAWPVVVETRRACDSRACYRPHSHPTVSIGVVDGGRSRFTGADGKHFALGPGALVVVPAQMVHACNPAPGGAWSYQMLYLDAGWWAAARAAHGLATGREEVAVYTQTPGLYHAFRELNARLFDPVVPVADKQAALSAFLVGALWPAQPDPLHEQPTTHRTGVPPHLEARLQSLVQSLTEGEGPLPALGELAAQVGLSRYQLIRQFRQRTGLSPHAWLLNQRIARARGHLRAGAALAEVAYRLGFADQSHFQRIFKAHVGVTPHRYRARRA